MAEGDGPAVHVDFVFVESEFVADGDALAGKRFIELPEVDVAFLQSGLLQRGRDGVHRAHAHDARLEGGDVVGLQAGNGLHAEFLDHPLGGDHHEGGAVGGLRAVAGRHAAAGGKHRAQLGQALHVGAAPDTLVGVEADCGLAALSVAVEVDAGEFDGRHAGLQASAVDGGGGLLVGADGKGVLGLAAHVEVVGHRLGGQAHAPVPLGVFLGDPGVGHDPPAAHRHARHAFGAAGDDQLLHAGPDLGRRDGDGLQSAGAVAVDGHPGHLLGVEPHQRDEAADVEALLGLGGGVADDDVVDEVGVEFRQRSHEVANDLGGEVVRADVAQRALGGLADRAAGSGDDVGVLHHVKWVEGLSCEGSCRFESGSACAPAICARGRVPQTLGARCRAGSARSPWWGRSGRRRRGRCRA